MLGVAEIIARRLRQKELKPYVQTILDSGETLLRLLTDALDFSRADAGQLELEQQPLAVAALMTDVANLWTARASEKGLDFTVAYDGPPGLWVLGDAVRLKQVFNNLIGNALKFTDQGSVTAHLRAERDGVHVRLRAEVADTGPGVEGDRLHSIFQPFVQEDAGRAKGGTGLGLSICRELIERMDGRITASSGEAGGLTVSFDIVLRHVEAMAPKALNAERAEPALPPLHVLIADDNKTNRLVAETLCGMFGCTSVSVCDGAQAVAAVCAGAFDLVLMDIKMPVMDGQAALIHIRGLAEPFASIPVLALTANADPWDAVAYLKAGFDGVVEKPINPANLLAAMQKAASYPARADLAHSLAG